MDTSNAYTVNDLIRDELYKNMDMEYGKFSASLNPGCGNIIGVRLPVLRKMAKEIASVNWKEYLAHALDDTFEETMLQAMVLGYAKGKIEEILMYAEEFVPKIDNWSVCDTFCNTFKIARQYPEEVWEFMMKYMSSKDAPKGLENVENQHNSGEFPLRMAAVMMLNHYINDAYIDKVLYAYDNMKNDGYYLKMGVAWGIAAAYVTYPEKTMKFLKNNHLDDFTYNKAIQKMRESYRISDADKKILKSMMRA